LNKAKYGQTRFKIDFVLARPPGFESLSSNASLLFFFGAAGTVLQVEHSPGNKLDMAGVDQAQYRVLKIKV
jgi:hypothetical protein